MVYLKKEFTANRNTIYQQIIKEKDVVIYRCSKYYPENDYTDIYWEVFVPRIVKADKYHNGDDYERYPSSECFGDWAWCCSGLKSLAKILRNKFNRDIGEFADRLNAGGVLTSMDE